MSAQGDSHPDAATAAVRTATDHELNVRGCPSHVRDDIACDTDFDHDAVLRALGFGGGLR